MEAEALVNLVDSCVMQFGGEGLSDLVPEIESLLPVLARSASDADFERAAEIGRLLAFQAEPEEPVRCATLLIDIAGLHIPRGRAREGLPLVEAAYDLAKKQANQPLIRRCCGVLAALYGDLGAYSVAVEYAAKALRMAEAQGDAHAIVASLANLVAALVPLGLHREVLRIANAAVGKYRDNPACAAPLVVLRANLAASGNALQQFPLSARMCEQAVQQQGLPRDANGLLHRVMIEGTWLKAAIGIDAPNTVRERLATIQKLTLSFRSPRLDLNRRVAEAAAEAYFGRTDVAIAMLLELKKETPSYPQIHRDCLALLVQTYQQVGDLAAAMIYVSEFMEFLTRYQIDRVRVLLDTLQQGARTETPGKDEIRAVIMVLQRDGPAVRADPQIPPERYREIFERLAVSGELREDPTGRHAYRVGRLARLLATAAGFGERYAIEIEFAARLHDIGKLTVPDGLLLKQGPLAEVEYGVFLRHVTAGLQILSQGPRELFELASEVVAGRHENWRGGGFPHSRQGEDIPIAARIVAIADAYDVMVSPRPSRSAMSHEEAVARILGAAGRRFDPKLAALFVEKVDSKREFMGPDAFNRWLDAAADDSPLVRARESMREYLATLAPIEIDEPVVRGAAEGPPDDPVLRV